LAQSHGRQRDIISSPKSWLNSKMLIGQGCILTSDANSKQKVKVTEGSVECLAPYLSNVRKLEASPFNDITSEISLLLSLKLANLTHIDFRRTQTLTDEGLESFAKSCRRLRDINISSCHGLTSRSLFKIAKHCRQLDSIDVSSTACATNKSLSALFAKVTTLASIGLESLILVDWDVVSLLFPANLHVIRVGRNSTISASHLEKIIHSGADWLEIYAHDCERLTKRDVQDLREMAVVPLTIHSNSNLPDNTEAGIREYIRYMIGNSN
jgi:hypothetical protein